MKIIITESQNKNVLKSLVKKTGWKNASKMVDGPKTLTQFGFNNNPMEFLNMFNDLDVVQSEEVKDLTLFRYEKGNNIIIYNRENGYVYVSYDVIWSFLENGFGLQDEEIQELTKDWLGETYNLRGITTERVINWWLILVG